MDAIVVEAIERDRYARSVISDRKGVKADVFGNNYADPRLLIGLNDEDPSMPNIYSYDLVTNELTLVMRNRRFPALFVDNALNIRLAAKEQPDGTVIYYRFMGFDKSNENIYWLWADDSSDLGKFIMFPISSPRRQITLFQPQKGEVGAIFWNFTERSPLAVSEVYHKHEWYVLNETAVDDMQAIVDYNPTASPYIVSYSVDQELILLAYDSAEKPFDVYLYRRANKSIELLFNTKPSLQEYRFNTMVGFVYTARDGLPIQAYLSLPPDTPLLSPAQASPASREYAALGLLPSSPQKMVIMVHGGPQSRDVYGFNTVNAWLTNRGYAVLQVNFRGSSGFGKNFTNAGHGEWGRKMHYDILDAVEFIVQHGGSYGGYEVLVALTTSPDVFACGVDVVGPSNLITLLETMPPYWEGYRKSMELKVGADPRTEEGRRFLESRSPLFFADRIVKPILIMQGANDPRVKQQESDNTFAGACFWKHEDI
ncbi:peptidase, S9A/B/C family, catalytic domain protein [Ancylostoma duodenale]|uniref:Peptidase, S9A/B/C family, catalytic domain protein n=1 Tax=Ancylostoma duodenale TaxID=51022 RepID=A0A0C2CVF9_9BILA|nr:peptidase, S9A/B/C family, catalytic domain protein [Ancylostoma duodenale]